MTRSLKRMNEKLFSVDGCMFQKGEFALVDIQLHDLSGVPIETKLSTYSLHFAAFSCYLKYTMETACQFVPKRHICRAASEKKAKTKN